jgi:hypothetical protein
MELDQKGSPPSESSTRNITNDEKQKENCAADQFFSSLLDSRYRASDRDGSPDAWFGQIARLLHGDDSGRRDLPCQGVGTDGTREYIAALAGLI